MHDWRFRIGSDPWKNLIAEECDAVSAVCQIPKNKEAQPDGGSAIPARPDSASFCYLPLTAATADPCLRSYLVFQTGRLFLVGVPKVAVEALKKANLFDLPLHVVLLTWEESHIDGLSDLFPAAPERWLTVWTSSWIWEETLRTLDGKPACDLQKYSSLSLEDVEIGLEGSDESYLKKKAVVFERKMDVRLGLGTRLSMDYGPHKLPFLRASFQCNHLRFIINPLDSIDSLNRLDDIRGRLKTAIRSFPSMKDDFLVRYEKLEELREEELRKNEPKSKEGEGWQVPHPSESWMFDQPVDLTMIGKRASDIRFNPHQPARPSISSSPNVSSTSATTPAAVRDASQILSQTAVAILCGGLGAKEKDSVDPSRRLSVSLENEEKQPRKLVLSILEWRLRQIHQWAKRHRVTDLPVLLMTSPDTEEIVREVGARFEDLVQSCEKLLRLIYLPQQLVPRLKESKGKLLPAEMPDGGWTLNARGHLDFLRLLCKWSQQSENQQKSLCFTIAFNNLGCVFDDRTLNTLAAFQIENEPLGVEIFKLTSEKGDRRPARTPDTRWSLMSYTREEVSGRFLRLFKEAYRGTKSKRTAGDIPVAYSSHTWYVNLACLRKWEDEVWQEPPLNRYILTADVKGRRVPRQDLDQTSHGDGSTVTAIPAEDPGKSKEGLYAHSRFLVVRTEDHIRDPGFYEALEETESPLDGDSQPIESGKLPFLEMTPTEMPYVWGGYAIRTFKGLPRRRIAETWEVSTHPSGPSSIYPNLRHPIPLREILLNKGDLKGDLPFMTKYLDCHDSLSVQVHPNNATAKYLSGLRPFNLLDKLGKEESFYVIQKAPHRKLHLFLGFNRDRIAPIARSLRPILLEHAGDTSKRDLSSCYNQLVTKLQECLKIECTVLAKALPASTQKLFLPLFQREVFLKPLNQSKKPVQNYRSLQGVFRYHVEEEGSNLAGQSVPALSLIGKEYLFAAIGIIRLIEEIAEYVRHRENDQVLQDEARQLFTCRIEETEGSLLRYFRKQEVRQDWWVRVPPGTVHSWQGGGNFLIELAQRSDNTFRILDFGRELSNATKRGMHYLAAMYSLSADGILDEESSKRLVFEADVQGTKVKRPHEYHSALKCRLFSGSAAGETEATAQPLQDPGWSVVMNPDNPVRLRTHTKDGQSYSEITLGRCRAVLIKPGTSFLPDPAHLDDRLLVVSAREERIDLVCISLGATKLEVALYRDGESPPIIWTKGKHPKRNESGTSYLDDMIDAACESIKELLKTKPNEKRASTPLRVAVSWPGYVKQIEGGNAELYSSDYSKTELDSFTPVLLEKIQSCVGGDYSLMNRSRTNPVILNDAAASALGEYRHPLGWLKDAPGMVLNVGSGLCAGFYLGTSKAAGEKRTPKKEKKDKRKEAEEKRTINACAGVGRWLYIDPRTGQMNHCFEHVALERLPSSLQNHVFQERVPTRTGPQLRTSIYLSSRGIALRFLSRLPKPEDFLVDVGWNVKKISKILNKLDTEGPALFVEGCEVIASSPEDFDIHKMIHKINAEAACKKGVNNTLARELIIEVALELAEVVHQTVRMMQNVAPRYTDCIRQVVLTGAVGEHFGRIDADTWLFENSNDDDDSSNDDDDSSNDDGDSSNDDGDSSKTVADKDLLVGIMIRCLSSSGLTQLPEKVRRSEVSISSIREIEGFLHHLATHPD